MVQESNNEELKAVVQYLFDRAIQRLLSASSTEEPPAKRQRRESANAKTGTETGIQNLDQACLTHIFGFLHTKDQSQAGAVCRTWREALRWRRRLDLTAAWNDIFAKLSIIVKDIQDSEALSVEEKNLFSKRPREDRE